MSTRLNLRLGTRGSDLARTQSGTIAAALQQAGFDVELTIIKTAGDQNTTASFGSIGPQGVFVREIEQALVERRVELAVHSFKDLPTTSPAELTIAAVPARIDPADLQRPRIGFAQTDEAFDRRCLAGAIRPEQTENLARVDLEAHAAHCLHGAVALHEIADDNVGRHG